MSTKQLSRYCSSYVITVNNICNSDKERLIEKDYCLDYSDNNYLIKIRIEGLITTIAFHKARLYAQKLSQYLPQKYAVPQIREMFQVDWHEYLQKMKVVKSYLY